MMQMFSRKKYKSVDIPTDSTFERYCTIAHSTNDLQEGDYIMLIDDNCLFPRYGGCTRTSIAKSYDNKLAWIVYRISPEKSERLESSDQNEYIPLYQKEDIVVAFSSSNTNDVHIKACDSRLFYKIDSSVAKPSDILKEFINDTPISIVNKLNSSINSEQSTIILVRPRKHTNIIDQSMTSPSSVTRLSNRFVSPLVVIGIRNDKIILAGSTTNRDVVYEVAVHPNVICPFESIIIP